ncbi:MAG: DUF58 domain-containing protein [Nitrososphaerales archaeon]
MKTTLRSRILLAALVGLGFCAVLFQDFALLIIFLVIGAVLFAEALWLLFVAWTPKRWFGISNVDLGKKLLYPGELSMDTFNFTKKVSGSVSLSTDEQFTKLGATLRNSEYSKEVKVEFKTPFAGEYFVRELRLLVLGPLKLFSRDCALPLSIKHTVYPKILQVAAASSRLLGSNAIGETPVNRAGIGTEFYDMREYQLGDDSRQINWMASARSDKLIVNERMKEVGGSCYLVLEARAEGYFERDRLATAFLQLANTLTMLRLKFGVVVCDGEKKISALKKIDFPENSLEFALGVALGFAQIEGKASDFPEELSGVSTHLLKSNEIFLAREGFELLSEIESSGRASLQRSVNSGGAFTQILGLASENEALSVLYVCGASASTAEIIELGSELKQRYGANFILVDPSMPWVVAASDGDAYDIYEKFTAKLRTLEVAGIECFVGEPVAIAGKL